MGAALKKKTGLSREVKQFYSKELLVLKFPSVRK